MANRTRWAWCGLGLVAVIVVWLSNSDSPPNPRDPRSSTPSTSKPLAHSANTDQRGTLDNVGAPRQEPPIESSLQGLVFLPSGEPAPFARVEARWLRGGGSFASVANEYGRFSMRVDRSAESIGEKTLGVVARSGTLVSNQTIVISWELGSRMWLPVRLRNPATLSARAVSVHGRGVAGAVFHVERRPTVITPGERRSTMAQRATFVADGDGRVQARVSAGLLMVWVRAPAGVFGPRISKAVGAGEAWEIGDRTVPDEKCVLRLRVSDTDGRPVSRADVRVEYGESVQRWLSDGPVDTRFHFMTDLDGVATRPEVPTTCRSTAGIQIFAYLPLYFCQSEVGGCPM